jgi:nudix-type nucleoside diphosphatase (YffH/AdpP family)
VARITHTRTVRDGYATVKVVTLADESGAEFEREVVDFGQSACVLPYDPQRKVALAVRLPRAPLLLAGAQTRLIEAPAGMIDAGESPADCARREAFEEAGVILGELERVGVCWPSPGVLAERSHLFLAPYGKSDLRGAGGGLASEHEGVEAEELTLSELWSAQEAGRLNDLKTLTLVQALRLRRPALFD